MVHQGLFYTNKSQLASKKEDHSSVFPHLPGEGC